MMNKLKECKKEWIKKVAKCAEKYTALNARSSSAFGRELSELLEEELECRYRIYIQSCPNLSLEGFKDFSAQQENRLLMELSQNFKINIYGEEDRKNLRKKFEKCIFN